MKRIFLILFFFTSVLTYAGYEHGNGGGAVVCRDEKKEILSVELLDLWEAKTFNEPLVSEQGNQNNLLKAALDNLTRANPLLGTRVKRTLLSNQSLIFKIPAETHLLPPTDAKNWIMKDNCVLESVAQYRREADRDRLYLNMDLLHRMSPRDQAALWFHEALYKVLRDDDSDEDSIRTRKITGQAFSQKSWESIPLSRFSCFYDFSSDRKSFSFSMSVALEEDQFLSWISRIESKWQVPSIRVSTPDRQMEREFVRILKQGNGPHQIPIVALALQYPFEGKMRSMTATLTPKIQSEPKGFYDFTLFLKPKMKTKCVGL